MFELLQLSIVLAKAVNEENLPLKFAQNIFCFAEYLLALAKPPEVCLVSV